MNYQICLLIGCGTLARRRRARCDEREKGRVQASGPTITWSDRTAEGRPHPPNSRCRQAAPMDNLVTNQV
jgi:hypothetical protein